MGSGVFVSDRDTEAVLVRSLAAAASVRTPMLRWYDATGEHLGSKCMVMEAVSDATDLQTVMAQTEPVEPLTDLFVDTFAAVHSTPLDALPSALPRSPDWDSYLDSVLDGYDRMADRSPSSAPVLRHISRWARSHRPPPVPLALTHGDCQPSNVLHHRATLRRWSSTGSSPTSAIRARISATTRRIPLQPNVYWADPGHFLARYRSATGLTEDQVNPEVIEYFLIIGMAMLLEQLLDAAAAIGAEQRPGHSRAVPDQRDLAPVRHVPRHLLSGCPDLGGTMITTPTTDELIRDCCRELTEEILPALDDDTLKLRMIMAVTVLSNTAVRAAHEIAWMREETDTALAFAREVLATEPDERDRSGRRRRRRRPA